MNAPRSLTRADVESVLKDNGFRPTDSAPHVWTDPSLSQFVRFPDEGHDDGNVIYGDAEREEPGLQLSYNKAVSVLAGGLTPKAAERAGFRVPEGVFNTKLLRTAAIGDHLALPGPRKTRAPKRPPAKTKALARVSSAKRAAR